MIIRSSAIKYLKRYSGRFLQKIERYSKRTPKSMSQLDYRSLMGLYFNDIIFELNKPNTDPLFVSKRSIGYDVIYSPSGEKISIKSQQEIFQRKLKNKDGLTKPKSVVLQNKLGKKAGIKDIQDLEFDVLLLIQRGNFSDKNKDKVEVAWGIVEKDRITLDFIHTQGEQILYKVSNESLSYFSGFRTFDRDFELEEKAEQAFKSGIDKLFKRTKSL